VRCTLIEEYMSFFFPFFVATEHLYFSVFFWFMIKNLSLEARGGNALWSRRENIRSNIGVVKELVHDVEYKYTA
jgi:hypothetical protein